MHTLTESNLTDVVLAVIDDLDLTGPQVAQVFSRAAFNHVGAVKQRVQNLGKNTDDQPIRTKSDRTFGAYSKAYGRERAKAGFQTARIDLTRTGELMQGFQVFPPLTIGNQTVVEAGFTTDRAGEIAGYLESYFGPVFYPTLRERTVIADEVEEDLLNLS